MMSDVQLEAIRARLLRGDPDEILEHAAGDLTALLAEAERARADARLSKRLFYGQGL